MKPQNPKSSKVKPSEMKVPTEPKVEHYKATLLDAPRQFETRHFIEPITALSKFNFTLALCTTLMWILVHSIIHRSDDVSVLTGVGMVIPLILAANAVGVVIGLVCLIRRREVTGVMALAIHSIALLVIIGLIALGTLVGR